MHKEPTSPQADAALLQVFFRNFHGGAVVVAGHIVQVTRLPLCLIENMAGGTFNNNFCSFQISCLKNECI